MREIIGKQPTVAVVGGGLGGLATTICLAKAGFDVHVFERAAQLGEIGAGINISPQATKVLYAIGLREQVEAIGNRVTGHRQRSMSTGEFLAETPFTDPDGEDRYGAPYYAFHRADLIEMLAGAIAPERIHLGRTCTDLTETPEGVTVGFADGSRFEADAVIGADGIHSQVRRHLYGEDEAEYTGQMVWRALVDASDLPEDVLGPHGFYGWIGKGSHLMTYFLRGTKVINITTQADVDTWTEEGWSIPGDPEQMRASFPGATGDLARLLDRVTDCSKWGLFGRRPSRDWGRGRIQLIGDAAHPMLPNAGQGAAQAFEDAYVLARWMDEHAGDLPAAFEGFREVRIPRAHAVQRQSLANSKLVHAGDWEQRRDTFRAREQSGDTPLGLGWIYDYDVKEQWDQITRYPLSESDAPVA
ncbi:FAD-dependent monooxygenase [Arthrobacter ginkgonis]|uniref:FAD-dependent monooxygenase n=1 Tax=Arthrobacter ginkgonis TaxID=1630594 RepID=A0ABP7C458_9MICC